MLWLLLSVLLLAAFALYPRIAEMFAEIKSPQTSQEQIEVEEFNPYTPITIVPNDYKEE